MYLESIGYMQAVANFMNKYNQPMRLKPEIPTDDELRLRRKLIEEEARETLTAIERCLSLRSIHENYAKLRGEQESLIIEVADGLADMLYVTFGTALSFGIPIESVFAEIHRSNMTKQKLGHTNVGEKIQKGNFSRPQIGSIIRLAGK